MARYMPASNLPVREGRAGLDGMTADFPDVSQLHRSEWEVVFDDFRESSGPTVSGGDPVLASYFDDNAYWVNLDQGSLTDAPEILVADGHTLASWATDAATDEGYETQAVAEQVFAKANRTIFFEALVGVEDVTATDIFVGINEIDTNVVNPTGGAVSLNNGVGFRLLASENDGDWACIHGGSTGGTVDVGDAGTGADASIASGALTNFVRLGIKLVGATPAITWYYNGVAVQTATATIFDKLSVPSFTIIAGGAAIEILWVDYYMLAQTRTIL